MKGRSRIALLMVLLFILGTGSIAAYQSMSKTITLVNDGKVTQYETMEVYVSELLETLQIELNEKDFVIPSVDTEIKENMTIVINKWYPTIQLIVDGEKVELKTQAKTVKEVLDTKKIKLATGDIVDPPLTTQIKDGLKIEIKTKKVVQSVIEEVIPFETEVNLTTELEEGEEKVTQAGQDGKTKKVIEVTSFGGVTTEEKVLSSEVIAEPVNEIILRGKKRENIIKDAYTGATYVYKDKLTMNATAYTDIDGDHWAGITASGAPTFVGMVAVDPNVIPLGTKLYVQGYGVAIAGDTGGAIKGHKIDLFYSTRSEALEFGRRTKEVYILEDQSIDVRDIRRDY